MGVGVSVIVGDGVLVGVREAVGESVRVGVFVAVGKKNEVLRMACVSGRLTGVEMFPQAAKNTAREAVRPPVNKKDDLIKRIVEIR